MYKSTTMKKPQRMRGSCYCSLSHRHTRLREGGGLTTLPPNSRTRAHGTGTGTATHASMQGINCSQSDAREGTGERRSVRTDGRTDGEHGTECRKARQERQQQQQQQYKCGGKRNTVTRVKQCTESGPGLAVKRRPRVEAGRAKSPRCTRARNAIIQNTNRASNTSRGRVESTVEAENDHCVW